MKKIAAILLLVCGAIFGDSQKEQELRRRLDYSIEARQRDNDRAAAQLAGLAKALDNAVVQTKKNADTIRRLRGPLAEIATAAEPVKDMAATIEQSRARLEQASIRAVAITAIINRIEKAVEAGFAAQRNVTLVYQTVITTIFLCGTVLIVRHLDTRSIALLGKIAELEAYIAQLIAERDRNGEVDARLAKLRAESDQGGGGNGST